MIIASTEETVTERLPVREYQIGSANSNGNALSFYNTKLEEADKSFISKTLPQECCSPDGCEVSAKRRCFKNLKNRVSALSPVEDEKVSLDSSLDHPDQKVISNLEMKRTWSHVLLQEKTTLLTPKKERESVSFSVPPKKRNSDGMLTHGEDKQQPVYGRSLSNDCYKQPVSHLAALQYALSSNSYNGCVVERQHETLSTKDIYENAERNYKLSSAHFEKNTLQYDYIDRSNNTQKEYRHSRDDSTGDSQLHTRQIVRTNSLPPGVGLGTTSPKMLPAQPSVSQLARKADATAGQQSKCDDASASSPTVKEELAILQTKYRQSARPNYHWAEKEFSVKDLRHLIPLLILELFDLKSDPVTKKVKGIWDKAPVRWPSNVPYIDPNNGQKPTGKPKKDVLLKMFNYLLNKYVDKVEGQETQREDTHQNNGSPQSGFDVVARNLSVEFHSAPTSSTNAPPFCTKPALGSSPNGRCQVSASERSLIPTSCYSKAHTNTPPPTQTSIHNTRELPEMPPLIPISEMSISHLDQRTTHTSMDTLNNFKVTSDNSNNVNTGNRSRSASDCKAVRALTFTSETLDECEARSCCPECESDEERPCAHHHRADQPAENTPKNSCQQTNTSTFRGMKARILGSCKNVPEMSKVCCQNMDSDPASVNENFNDVKSNSKKHQTNCLSRFQNCQKEIGDIGEKTERPVNIHRNEVLTISGAAVDISPAVKLSPRVKEKVYYIHWTGWLAEGDIKLLYDVLDNLKKMEPETLKTENGGEMFIEMSHLFESVLDIVIYRRKIQEAQVTVLKKIKQLF